MDIRVIEHHGETVIVPGGFSFTKNEHWIVNGKRFEHKPTKEEIREAYKEMKGCINL